MKLKQSIRLIVTDNYKSVNSVLILKISDHSYRVQVLESDQSKYLQSSEHYLRRSSLSVPVTMSSSDG